MQLNISQPDAETQNIQKPVFSNDTRSMNEATSSNVLKDKINPRNTPLNDSQPNAKTKKAEKSIFSNDTRSMNETTSNNVVQYATSVDNTEPEIPSVKDLPEDESTNVLADKFMFLNSLSPLNVIIIALCVVIVLYLIILITVALICLRRRKDVHTAGRYSCNIAQQYQGEKRRKDKDEQSADDIKVGLSLSSGLSSLSPRSLDTVTTTSDKESLGPRKLHFQEEDQNTSVSLNLSSFDESDSDLIPSLDQ